LAISRRRKQQLVILIVGFLIGHFGRALLNLDLKKEVQATDLLNFVTTVVIAVVVGTYLQRKLANVRIEKDLLIKDIQEVIELLHETRDRFVTCFNDKEITSDDNKAIKGLLRNLSKSLSVLENCIADCKATVGKTNIQSVKATYFEYKAVLTDADFDKKRFSGETFNEEERVYGEFRGKLRLLINEINRK
jgi:hypothetical protein